MPRIQLLPAALADQIAAGEVVERPASVVKELVENALDAHARRVEIEVERGGLGRIVVADDGDGMDEKDAHLCLRRHATSKLRSADDLFRLDSFGFRGEALPSIASVCELVLTTRPADRTAAYQLRVRAGQLEDTREVGAPAGTRVEAIGLFGNVPARLKFQKSSAVEAGHVVDAVVRLALGEPGAHLRLRVDGRVVLELPAHPSLAERAIAVVRRTAPGATLGTARVEEGAVAVEAHVASPAAAVQSARRVHLLVNRRAVRDRGLLAAVQLGFGELLPRGRHPLAVVAVELPAADVDVNVHPQKLEVRLARAAEVYAAVRHAVARAVAAGGFVTAEGPSRYAELHADDDVFAAEAPDDDFDGAPLERGAERGRAYDLVRALAGADAARIEADAADAADAPGAACFLAALPGGYLVFREPAGLLVIDQRAASALARDLPESDGEALGLGAELDEGAALALLGALRAAEGRLGSLEQTRWRGRRPLVRVPLSELWRRHES